MKLNTVNLVYSSKAALLDHLINVMGFSTLIDANPDSDYYGLFIIDRNINYIDLSRGFDLPVLIAEYDAFTEPDDLETELYPELLDNNETKLSLEDWIDDSGGQRWGTLTDNDLKAMELIEKYNKNVLLLRATKKTRVVNELEVDSGGSDVSLVGVENQLSSINDKLQYTYLDYNGNFMQDNITKSIVDLRRNLEVVKEDENNEKYPESITKVLEDKNDTKSIVVETVEKAPFNPYLDKDNNDIYGV